MTADKRKVTTDALETLGTIIGESEARDAIHLAVEPVMAGQDLMPCDHVVIVNGVALRTEVGEGVGIVDPFLHEKVKVTQRFWLVVYPRQITSLRHVWTHPAFSGEQQKIQEPQQTQDVKRASVLWLENWLRGTEAGLTFDQFIEVVEGGRVSIRDESDDDDWMFVELMDDEYIMCRGFDAHEAIPPDVWVHVEVVLGRKPMATPEFFTCSC